MITAGPSAAGITARSRKRLLACLTADDPDGAAHEIEVYLRVLNFMGRITAPSPQGETPPHGETADRIA
jgi:hypothetical protein